MTEVLLEMNEIRKTFSGVAVLDNAKLEVKSGESVGLLGSNGAGKSTLIKILSGVYSKDRGKIKIKGNEISINNPSDAIKNGIGLLPQELSIHSELSVAENLLMGNLPTKKILGVEFTDKNELKNIASSGTINISKWTNNLNKALQSNPGHTEYFLNLKHAAYSYTKKILFVNRGVDITRPLSAQNDCFWWGFQNFSTIQQPYKTFLRIVRGYESEHLQNIEISKNNVVCTLFKQPLSNKNILCGIFTENGEILDLFENN